MAKTLISLDVGERKIGVARANTIARIPEALVTIPNNKDFKRHLETLIKEQGADELVVGLPRNMSGEETAQTRYVRNFIKGLMIDVPVHFQDETLTSVHAADRLDKVKGQNTKEDIDAMAAVIILEDYFQENF